LAIHSSTLSKAEAGKIRRPGCDSSLRRRCAY